MTEVNSSRETAHGYEQLADEVLGDLLAAGGNHEAKAITYLSMKPDIAYASVGLKHLLREKQGGQEGHNVNRSTLVSYCANSFEPVGLLVKTITEEGKTYFVKDEENAHVTALYGVELQFSEQNPDLSLEMVFGGMAFPNKKGTSGVERAPGNRLRILEVLGSVPEYPVSLGLLTSQLGLPYKVMKHSLEELSRKGVITYNTVATGKDLNLDSTITVQTDLQQARQVGQHGSLSRVVIDELRRTGGKTRYGAFVEQVKQHDKYAAQQSIDDNVGAVLKGLEEQGIITREGFVSSAEISLISMDVAMRDKLRELVASIRRIAGGNAQEIEQANEWTRQLLSNPERVRTLIAKAYRASSHASGVSRAEKQSIVRLALAGNKMSTTTEIMRYFGSRVGRLTVKKTLEELAVANEVESIRDEETNTTYWGLATSKD